MAAGTDLYEENQRLKADLDRLRAQHQRTREQAEAQEAATVKFLIGCVKAFFEDRARLLVEHRSSYTIIRFEIQPERTD